MVPSASKIKWHRAMEFVAVLNFGVAVAAVVFVAIKWFLCSTNIRRFLISLNSIDCINFDVKTIILNKNKLFNLYITICSNHHHHHHSDHHRSHRNHHRAMTTTTTIQAQYNFYSWFRIFFACFSFCDHFLFIFTALQPTSHSHLPSPTPASSSYW